MAMIPGNHSYVHGVSTTPLSGETIGDKLYSVAHDRPDNLAIVVPFERVRWTYRELLEKSDELALGLLALGLESGDRIGMLATNCSAWPLVQYATARIGLILVNLNPAYQQEELAFALKHVECKAVITILEHKSTQHLSMLRTLIPSLEHSEPGRLHTAEFPELKHVITLSEEAQAGCWRFSDIPKPADKQGLEALERISGKLQFDDVINIQFTSGTTGTPKATALTHHNIVNNAYFVGEKMRLNEKDRICLPVPMYHCFAMVMGTLCALMHKASAVFTSAGFDAQAVLEVIETESCTALYGVPTMFISELEHPDFNAYDLTSLRTGIMAGAPCPEELMLRVTNDMHLQDLTIAYGMTETGPVSFQTSPDEDIEHRTQTVGQVLPHVEVKIVDDDGLVVPRGTRGELLTRGYSVMPYYWNDTERTSKAVDEHGWIKSGDIACIDQDGYCSIVGRTKDMLIRGGENIFPREIEEYLYRMPGIQQVEVFGIADKRLGESVCAWIQTEPNTDITAADIIDFCEGKIAHYKIPAHIRFVDSFPMTVTGKVQKFKMKAQMEDELSKIHQSNLKDVRSNIKTADAS